MKRIVLIIIALCMMVVSHTVFASYPKYLGENKNYIICAGHHGIGYYIDRSSLDVEKYNPPHYIIAVKVAIVEDADKGKTQIQSFQNYRFYYNWNDKTMWYGLGKDWTYISREGTWAEIGVPLPTGELAFSLAYNMKFYGLYDELYAR